MLLYGPPGTGKTLMARACAAQTKVTGPVGVANIKGACMAEWLKKCE